MTLITTRIGKKPLKSNFTKKVVKKKKKKNEASINVLRIIQKTVNICWLVVLVLLLLIQVQVTFQKLEFAYSKIEKVFFGFPRQYNVL